MIAAVLRRHRLFRSIEQFPRNTGFVHYLSKLVHLSYGVACPCCATRLLAAFCVVILNGFQFFLYIV